MLIVGDSLTHASAYPNEIARLLALPGTPRWTMIGTHKPAGAAAGVVHEGYGGWTWAAFTSRFDPKNPEPGYKGSSPFVFAVGEPPEGKLDVARYFAERAGGKVPDFITVMLGINDSSASIRTMPSSSMSGSMASPRKRTSSSPSSAARHLTPRSAFV